MSSAGSPGPVRPSFRLVAPYPEGGIVEFGRRLSEQGSLEGLFLPAKPGESLVGRAAALGVLEEGVARRLRRGVVDIPEARSVKRVGELGRMALSGIGAQALLGDYVARLKIRFGAKVAAAPGSPDIVFGLPNSLLASARSHPQRFYAVHAVDAHPRVHNQALEELYGSRARVELLSEFEVDHLEAEFAAAQTICVPSQVVADGMLEHGVPSEKILKLPYGVSFSGFTPSSGQRLNGKRQLLYVGQVSYRKGVPFLLDAMRGSGAELTIVGRVVEREILRDLPSEVRYAGVVPHAEVTKMMNEADAFIIASIEDACPLVVPEAVASGLPVITTTAVGAVEMLSPGDFTLVTPGSVAGLRDAIRNVEPLTADQRNERAERIRGGQSGVQSWRDYSDALLTALRSRWERSRAAT